MKLFWGLIFLFVFNTVSLSCSDSLKITVIEAIKDEDKLSNLSQLLCKETEDVTSYHGVLLALKAKKSKNWLSKLFLISKSLDSLNVAVENKDNLETRFLRYIVCHHLPNFSVWKSSMDEDLKVMKQAISQSAVPLLPKKVQEYILLFFTEQKVLSTEQITALKNQFNKKGAL